MRVLTFLLLVILVSATATAFQLTDLETQGADPVVYGERVAFVTFEDAVDKDLNADGDMKDRVVQFYDVDRERLYSTNVEGMRIAFAGDFILIEDKSRLLWQYDVDDKLPANLDTRGSSPAMYAQRYAFVTSEKDVNLDLNRDGDLIDEVIRYAVGNNTDNTQADGINPVVLKDYVVFETNEALAGVDLNDDDDTDDTIIRYLDFDRENVRTTRLTGENPVAFKEGLIIVTDEDSFWTIDLLSLEKHKIGPAGNDQSFFDNVLVYERDGAIKTMDIRTGIERDLGLNGTNPHLFGTTLAFVNENKSIIVLEGEDEDGDQVYDITDNCPTRANEQQEDGDKDGLGDVCDRTDDPVVEINETVVVQNVTQNATPPVTANVVAPKTIEEEITAPARALPETPVVEKKKDDGNGTFWFLMAVGLATIAVVLYLALPGWLRRRRKSYGF